MAKATRLPSGNWRVKVYSHTDKNGKKIYESFTASTKAEAEMQASKFANNKIRNNTTDLTVAQAIDKYIESKTNVLSPSTIRGYRRMQRNNFAEINNKKIKKLTSSDIQFFISNLSVTMSPKSVKNIYGLLMPSIALFAPDLSFKVTLPTRNHKTLPSPSDEDVVALYKSASPWLQKCILLGAFVGMRRGEIASLKFKDIDGEYIHIHSDMVQDEEGNWIYKETPKNYSSIRKIWVHPVIIKLLGTGSPDSYVVDHNPNSISKCFIHMRDKMKVNVRFHDLRHYCMSIGAAVGIPDIYMADFGGYRHNSPVLKNTYQGNIKSISDGYSKQLGEYFAKVAEKF